MTFRLVHKASSATKDRLEPQQTTMAGSKISITDKAQDEYLDPDDPEYDPRVDPDVGPHDPDNDYLPDDDMTDNQAAEETARLEKEGRASACEFNKNVHGIDDEQVPIPRTRPNKACDGCKNLKKGCSRTLPQCEKCQSRGCPCIYWRG